MGKGLVIYRGGLEFAPHGGAFSNFTSGSKLVINYQISTNTNSTKSNSTTGSQPGVNYEISINVDSANNNSTTDSKLAVNYQISDNTKFN